MKLLKKILLHIFSLELQQLFKNTKERNNKLGDKNKMLMSIPFGTGFKYLINKQFSIALEFEIKKHFMIK